MRRKKNKKEVGFYFAQEDGGEWNGPYSSADEASRKFKEDFLKNKRTDKAILHVYSCVAKLEITMSSQIMVKELE